MRLDLELVKRGLSVSRTEAQEYIQMGGVIVNGEVATKQTRHVTDEDVILVTGKRKYVSRGGEKLEGALLDVFGSEEKVRELCSDRRALDVGSSTGGFTDCLLGFGAAHIDAVDVGTDQLHGKLRKDERVSIFEQTDIRNFTPNVPYDIIVADLSFIPLSYVLSKILELGSMDASYFLLLKPQFEVGKGATKKGIVKDLSLIEEVLSKYKLLAQEYGAQEVQTYPCRLTGGDGNQEYFLYFKKS